MEDVEEAMGFLPILRESSSLLRAHPSLFITIMLLFLTPFSALLLSRSLLLPSPLLHRLASSARLLLPSSLTSSSSFSSSLSLSFLSLAFSSPAFFTLCLLAKAAVSLTVACSYSGTQPSLSFFLPLVPKLWKRLAFTYLWISLLILGFASAALFLLLLAIGCLDALAFSADLVFLTEIALGVFFSVIFAQLLVIGNLASVVSSLEEHSGLTALMRSLFLIKGRTQVALCLFLATTAGTAMLESLYQYRVIGIPKSSYAVTIASRLWEAPLLVLMYSFLFLFDAIMSCVFYFNCKSSTANVSDKQAVWEHMSIGLDPQVQELISS